MLDDATEQGTVDLAPREAAERRSRLRAFRELMQLGDAEAGYQMWRQRKGLAPDDEHDDDA